MRMKGGNEEGTLYLSDLILSVFWGDVRCSGWQRRNQQEQHCALQTHPEKNKENNFLWWQIKKQGWHLLMMAKQIMTLPTDSSAGKRVKGVPLSKWFYIGGRHTWRPGLSAKWPSGQVARERLSRRKRNFDRSELPGSGKGSVRQGGESWWWR